MYEHILNFQPIVKAWQYDRLTDGIFLCGLQEYIADVRDHDERNGYRHEPLPDAVGYKVFRDKKMECVVVYDEWPHCPFKQTHDGFFIPELMTHLCVDFRCHWQGDLAELGSVCPSCGTVAGPQNNGNVHKCPSCLKSFEARSIGMPDHPAQGRLCCPKCGGEVRHILQP